MNRTARVWVTSFGLAVICLLAAGPALGVNWRSSSNPLYVFEDDVEQAKAYGKFYNDGQVSAMSTSWQYDLKPGGNKVRVETDFWFYGSSVHCVEGGNCWFHSASKQTVETNTATWVKDSRARNLSSQADRARGSIDICEIQAFHNDPCSAAALPSFNY